MLLLNDAQRAVLADKLADFGNIAAGSLIFGAAITERLFVAFSILLGVLLVVSSYFFALLLRRNRPLI